MAPQSDKPRYSAIDNLRAWMMLLLVPFHAAIPYITIDAPHGFNDPKKHVFFDALVLSFVSFRRPVFFVVGGLFAAMLVDRYGVKGMVKNRFLRIFLPLCLGWIVLSPVTRAAYRFAEAVSSTGSVERGFRELGRWKWLRWSNPYHLWFLIALLLFYAVALLVRAGMLRLPLERKTELAKTARKFFESAWRPLVFVPIVAAGFMPSEFYRQDRGNPFLGLALALFFGLGWVLYGQIDLLAAQAKHAWKYMALGLLAIPLATWTKGHAMRSAVDATEWKLAAGASFSLMAALLTFGVLGIFIAHLDRKSAAMRYLSDSSYWIYLAHMPVVVFIGGLVSPLAVPAIVKLTLAVGLTVPIVLAMYQLFVRYTWLGTLLNGPRERAGGEPPATKPAPAESRT